MSPAHARFLTVISWVLIYSGLIGTVIMGGAIFFIQGGPVKGVATLLPATIMFLTLSVGIGGMLRVLLSIDQHLMSESRNF
jgi:ABC-type transport system involved in multi-copper enzyme maturation permease subunit